MAHIFISHSTKDNDFTFDLAKALEAADLRTWVDRKSIKSGERWLLSIQKAIEGCAATVVVMSRAARDSEWVEREVLMAMDLKKPLHIALIEDIPLPLYLINRQFTRFDGDGTAATQTLIEALQALDEDAAPRRLPQALSPLPDQDNFFDYLAQLPGGEANALIARDLYHWGKQQADAVEFGGKVTPGFHVRVHVGSADLTVFSLWAYPRQPAAQVQFQYLSEVAPYDEEKLRRSTLRSLNRLMAEDFHTDKADRRPTLPLHPALNSADKLETFKDIMGEIIDNLRSQ